MLRRNDPEFSNSSTETKRQVEREAAFYNIEMIFLQDIELNQRLLLSFISGQRRNSKSLSSKKTKRRSKPSFIPRFCIGGNSQFSKIKEQDDKRCQKQNNRVKTQTTLSLENRFFSKMFSIPFIHNPLLMSKE